MKTEKLLNAIGGIDDKLIADAEHDKSARHGANWRRLSLVAACLALIACAGIATHFMQNRMTVGAFTMDVNPSVEYTVAKNGTVKDVNFINSDAEEALRAVVLKNESVAVAVERTITVYQEQGYTDKSHGTVLVSFDSRINGNSKVKDELVSAITGAFEQMDAIETLVFHEDSEDEQAGKLAGELNISRGKADYILAASGKTGMTSEELSTLPLDELLVLQRDNDDDDDINPFSSRYIGIARAKLIALKDAGLVGKVNFTEAVLIDGGIKTPYYRLAFDDGQYRYTYHIDASLGHILSKSKVAIFSTEPIPLEKAKQIAIRDAGLENVDMPVIFTREQLITDQGMPFYMLEFYTYHFEYIYKIDAADGDILFSIKKINLDGAKQIALNDAGVTADVTFIEEKLVDDGVKTPYYSLIFTDQKTTWTYRIDASLGTVLEKSSDQPGAVTYITVEEAKAIALSDAGFGELSTEIVFTHAELYRNQGEPYYLLKFYTGQYEYIYQVDAKTGNILYSRRYLHLSDAKKIALKDAGSPSKVTFTEETLVDGGIKTPYYSFVFDNGQTRWTYRIDAALGNVLEKKNDDIGTPTPVMLTVEEAKTIALKDAGLYTVDTKIVFTEEVLHRNGGKPCYILSFYTNTSQYFYKVDAYDGSILEKKVEPKPRTVDSDNP